MAARNFKRGIFFCLGLIGVFLSLYLVVRFREELRLLYSSPQALRDYIRGWGVYGPFLFIGLQVLQVIVFIIPGEVTQVTGGYLFGFWHGLFYSIVGITLGAMFDFFLARMVGKPLILKMAGRERVERFIELMESSRAKGVVFLLFLLPGFPKDLLCYVVGLTRYGFSYFLAVSTLGRLPALVISTYVGDAAALQAWKQASIAVGTGVMLFALGMWGRREFLSRHPERNDSKPKDSAIKDAVPDKGESPSSGSPPEGV